MLGLVNSSRQRRLDLPCASSRETVPHRAVEGSQASESASLRMRQLEDELQSLRDMYAQKIARTELKCEGLLCEKDKQLSMWQAEAKQETERMKATVTIMAALFDKRHRTAREKMAQREATFQKEKQSLEEELAQVNERCDEKVRACKVETETLQQ
eukprot:1212605-Amphidinium_carterae.1